jgi:hypothetical protein
MKHSVEVVGDEYPASLNASNRVTATFAIELCGAIHFDHGEA